MSARNRGTQSIALDAYPTPPWVVRRLLECISLASVVYSTGHWLEPALGTGYITRAVDQMRYENYLSGTDWTGLDLVTGIDYLTWRAPEVYDVAITNPPFSLAFEFARKMVQEASNTFLLTRLNILEAGKRSGRLSWLKANTPDVYVLPDRPCFSHTIKCANGSRPAAKGGCRGIAIAWDAPTPALLEGPLDCGCRYRTSTFSPEVRYRTAGTDATGYCWLHWRSAELPRSTGLITHLAETPASERVDRVIP